MSTWMKSFINSLERLIEKPPYLIFFFVGAVFVIISLITKYNFEKMSVFFFYSVVGIIWRYAEKDLVRPLKAKYPDSELWIRVIYHIGNFVLLIALFYFLSLK